MDKDTKDIFEAVNFIEDHTVTKAELNEAVETLDNRLTAIVFVSSAKVSSQKAAACG
jgi:hypothetical protein